MTRPHFHEVDGNIIYRESLSPWTRLLVAGFGLAMILLAAAFAWHAGWGWPPRALAALPAVLLGSVFLALALIGVRQLRFDRTRRVMHLTTRGPFGQRRQRIPYTRIEPIVVRKREGLDDPDDYVLALTIIGQPAMELGGFATQAEAAQWRDRLADELGST